MAAISNRTVLFASLLNITTMITILFILSNPTDQPPLGLSKEFREIDERIRKSKYGRMFNLAQGLAVRTGDIQELLLRHRPSIVHFSGYGNSSSEIILENEYGNSCPVPVEALSDLFAIFVDEVRCVVLNTCYSAPQAEAIAEHIDCVVGMSRIITDEAAIRFASSFYQALGFGKDIEKAFKLGCHQLCMEPFGGENAPRLIASYGDPRKLVFTKPLPPPEPRPDRPERPKSNTINPGLKNTRETAPPPVEMLVPGGKLVKGKNARRNGIVLSLILLIFACLIIGLSAAQIYKRQAAEINPADGQAQLPTATAKDLGPDATPAERTLAQAENDYNNHQYEPAIAACRGLLASNPNEPRVNLLLGSAYYQLGNSQSFGFLSKALKMNQEIRLPIKHHHFDGIVKLDDGLCSGYLTFRKGGLEFRSIDRQGHDFNVTPDKIRELIDESSSLGRLHLKIDGLKGGVSSIVDYNFYPPFTELRKVLTRTKAFCEEQACYENIQTLYRLLQQLKK